MLMSAILAEPRGFPHLVRGAADELHRYGFLEPIPRRLLDRLARLADRRLARDHFRHVQSAAIATDERAERHVGHTRHRRKHDGTFDTDRADLDWG